MVKRAMDAGALSLLLPFVQNADEARRAVAYTRYPPEGVRGVAGSHRGSRYGNVGSYLQRANSEICVIVQIETVSALDRLEEIARSPASIRSSSVPPICRRRWDCLGDMGNPTVQEKLAGAAANCRRPRQACGIIGADPEMVGKFSTTVTRGRRSARTSA